MKLPEAEAGLNPVRRPHQQQSLLHIAQLTDPYDLAEDGFPDRRRVIDPPVKAGGDGYEKELRVGRIRDEAAKEHAVTATGISQVGGEEGLTNHPHRASGIEITHAVQAQNSGHGPVTANLVAAAHARRVVGGPAARFGDLARALPPVTAETQNSYQHR